MRTTEVDLQELASVPVLAGCSRAELAEVDARATELRLPAGRVLLREGSRARELVIVLDGYVTTTRGGQLAAQVGPGSILGAREMAEAVTLAGTAVAKTVVRVLVMSLADYADLGALAPPVAARLAGEVPVAATSASRLARPRAPMALTPWSIHPA